MLLTLRRSPWGWTLALAVCTLAGCQPWSGRSSQWPADLAPPADLPPADLPEHGSTDPDLAAIAAGEWVSGVRTLGAPEPAYRWRHSAIEAMLARPENSRPDFSAIARDRRTPAPVAASAAVAAARQGRAASADPLAAAVGDRSLKLTARCAAAEALGGLPADRAVPHLRKLLDELGRHAPGQAVPYVADLHAELVRSLARHVEPADDPRFHAALSSPAGSVRREVACAWQRATRGDFPLVLLGDTDPQVRAAAVAAVAHCRPPQVERALEAALSDSQLEVRLAAVAALGELGGVWAETQLRAIGPEAPEWIRAAAARAWARLGHDAALAEAAKDKAWRVRAAVAESLTRFPTAAGAALARQLLSDTSAEVQQRVVAAVADWPLPLAGPILLDGLACPAWQVRQQSAEVLAADWPPAGDFPVRSDAAQRQAARERLVARFVAEVGKVSPGTAPVEADRTEIASSAQIAAVAAWLDRLESGDASQRAEALAALRPLGSALPDALARLLIDRQRGVPEVLYREVLPGCDPVFVQLRVLAEGSVEDRRRAVSHLEEQLERRPLGRLAMERLAAVVALESDQVVWLGALRLVELDPSDPAGRLALLGLGHPSPEVRAAACRHLADHPQPRWAAAIEPLLVDSSRPVVLAAATALGRSGARIDTARLRSLLVDPNEALQLEVAIALMRLGDPAGEAALERLAYSTDTGITRRVAEMMGEQPRPGFLLPLRHLLDGPSGPRLAALESLPRVAGEEPPLPTGATTDERLRVWKEWLDRRR